MTDIFDNPHAYDRLYGPVTIAGRKVDACVMPLSPDDPIADLSTATDARTCDLLVRKIGLGGWNDPANLPAVGATVVIPAFVHDGYADCDLAVTSCTVYDRDNYLVKARTTKHSTLQ